MRRYTYTNLSTSMHRYIFMHGCSFRYLWTFMHRFPCMNLRNPVHTPSVFTYQIPFMQLCNFTHLPSFMSIHSEKPIHLHAPIYISTHWCFFFRHLWTFMHRVPSIHRPTFIMHQMHDPVYSYSIDFYVPKFLYAVQFHAPFHFHAPIIFGVLCWNLNDCRGRTILLENFQNSKSLHVASYDARNFIQINT